MTYRIVQEYDRDSFEKSINELGDEGYSVIAYQLTHDPDPLYPSNTRMIYSAVMYLFDAAVNLVQTGGVSAGVGNEISVQGNIIGGFDGSN